MIKRFSVLALSLVFILFSSSCAAKKKNFSATTLDYFDTVTTVSGYFNSQNEFDEAYRKIEEELEIYHKLLDIYNDYDKINNIKTINDNAGIKAVEVDSRIIELLEFSKEAYTLTNGNVNVCMGSVLKIWHDARQNKVVPASERLKNANEYISIDNLVIDKQKSTVFLKKKGCSLDVGAVAKGFVCEQLKPLLKEAGFENGIINIGGNVMTVGKKAGEEDFSVGIKNPMNLSENIYVASVSDLSVVTSGDYERYFEVDSKRYNHIISPQTLMPADINKSVTVICDDAAKADVLSTSLFICGFDEGIQKVNSIKNCEACIIDNDGVSHFSSGFQKYIKK